MRIFDAGIAKPLRRARIAGRAFFARPYIRPSRRTAGNVFFALFAAVAMVGAVGYGFNTVLRGPISGMTEVTRRTVAESTIVTSSRLAIVGATTQQDLADCDADGMVEPLPFASPLDATQPVPAGGGLLPPGLVPDSKDPWKTEYGYCAWDSGTKTIVDNVAACGGSTAKRLPGAPTNKQYSIAIISAGKDKKFQTSCLAYNNATPTASLLNRPAQSDDIVLGYTYAEANDLGAGMWAPMRHDTDGDGDTDVTVAKTRNALEGTGGATFGDKVVLQGDLLTGGGLVLPGDPGDDSLTGACNTANDKQIRRNLSTVPPTLEICNFASGLGWAPLSGTAAPDAGGGATTGALVSHWKLDDGAGTTVTDSGGPHHGTITGGATWNAKDAILGGALTFDGVVGRVRVPNSPALQPNAISLAFWVRPDAYQPAIGSGMTWGKVVGKEIATPPHRDSYMVAVGSNGQLDWVTGGGTSGTDVLNIGTVSTSGWSHIVVSYDPAASSKQKRTYINGELATTKNLTTPMVYDDTSAGDLNLGGNGLYEGLAGSLDEVRLYNYALSDVEVHNLFNTTKPSGYRNTTPAKAGQLVGWGNGGTGILGTGSNSSPTYPSATLNGYNYVQASGSPMTSCGVKAGGKVWCWGFDNYGQLGNGGSNTNTLSPTPVYGLDNVVKVSAGSAHVCALQRSGNIWCWGDNASGQLGTGNTTSSNVPVKVPAISDFTDVSVGSNFTCAVRQSGEGWCWGNGADGGMGDGSATNNPVPGKISNVTDFVSIMSSMISNSACGVTKRGLAYCWGAETNGNFGNGATGGTLVPSQVLNIEDFVDVEIGTNHGCGLRSNGQIWCWGDDSSGQLGNGTPTTAFNVPTQVVNILDFKKMAVSNLTSCGVRANGEVWCWGSDISGAVGNGAVSTVNQQSPVRVWNNIVDIAGFSTSFLAIMDTSPRPTLPVRKNMIAAKGLAPCALLPNGSAWCWGLNSQGQAGLGSNLPSNVHAPMPVIDPGPWLQISGGYNGSCGIKTNGSLWCWGDSTSGRLGTGATVYAPTPGQVVSTQPWASVSTAISGSCGIKSDGTLWCWGAGGTGRVGNGGTGNQTTPVQVGTRKWLSVETASSNTCGITDDQRAWCWGANGSGQLGNGTASGFSFTSPNPVSDPGPWAQLSVGTQNVCGIKQDGSLWCWGAATDGKLANNILIGNATTPQLVAEPGPWAHVSITGTASCAIKVDGSAWCWGVATNGLLGNGTTSGTYAYPVPVSADNNWRQIETGLAQNCGIKKDNSIWCWGADSAPGLGNGQIVTAAQSTPVRVMTLPLRDPWTFSSHGWGMDLLPGLDAIIDTNRWVSATGAAGTGLGFAGSGRTSLAQPGQNDVRVSASGTKASTQIGLKALSATGGGPDIRHGLAAHYEFNETSGTVSYDEGPNEVNVATTSSVNWVAGRNGNAVEFPTNTYFETAGVVPAISSSDFSVSAWIKRNGTYGQVLSGANNYGLLVIPSGAVMCQYFDGMFGGNTIESPMIVPDNTWTHVSCTQENGFFRLYMNGVMVAEYIPDEMDFPSIPDSSPHGIVIGGSGSLAVDDLYIHNRRLTSAEVLKLSQSGKGNPAPLVRLIGVDASTGNFEIARDATGASKWLDQLDPDFEITDGGNVGIGTYGAPQAKLDVNGAIKIGAGGTCGSGNSGTIYYDTTYATNWKYCTGTGWKPFGSFPVAPWSAPSTGLSLTGNTSCALRGNGEAYCWGYNVIPAVGDGTTVNKLSPTLVQTDTGPGGWSDWTLISGTCGLRADGSAWCWGQNSGNGSSTQTTRPAQVKNSANTGFWTDWIWIVAEDGNRCGIRANGTAWCWGFGSGGMLGNGTNMTYYVPTEVTTNTGPGSWYDWTTISVGMNNACGLRVDGSAWCWGANSNGQLGIGTTGGVALRPTRVMTDVGGAGWNDWTYIGTTASHTCGLRANGTAWCWGGNTDGRLGDGTTVGKSLPVQVKNSTNSGVWADWIALDTGNLHTCGVRANGEAYCWGTGSSGQLGIGNTFNNSVPKLVVKDAGTGNWSDWVAIGLGWAQTCGLRVNGALYCWGSASYGQVGDGTTTAKTRPVQIR